MEEFYQELGLVINEKQVFPALILQLSQIEASGKASITENPLIPGIQPGSHKSYAEQIGSELPMQMPSPTITGGSFFEGGVEVMDSVRINIPVVCAFLEKVIERMKTDVPFRFRMQELFMLCANNNSFSVTEALSSKPHLKDTLCDLRGYTH